MAESHYQSIQYLHVANDPNPLILSQLSDSNKPQLMELTTKSFIIERGPRYIEYSDLRDKRLRKKIMADQPPTPEKERDEKLQNRSFLTPPRKQVKFNPNFITPPRRPKAPSILTQSTPDFVSSLRKENRKPVASLPPMPERWMTPPAGPSKSGKLGGGSRSANSAEKKSGGLMARKSYASMEELKGLRGGTRNATGGRGILKTVLGYRQF